MKFTSSRYICPLPSFKWSNYDAIRKQMLKEAFEQVEDKFLRGGKYLFEWEFEDGGVFEPMLDPENGSEILLEITEINSQHPAVLTKASQNDDWDDVEY